MKWDKKQTPERGISGVKLKADLPKSLTVIMGTTGETIVSILASDCKGIIASGMRRIYDGCLTQPAAEA